MFWIFKWQASYLNETEQISVEMNTPKCPKIIQLLRVHRYLMIYSIDSNGKSQIRRFAILYCINRGIVLTGNALIRRGASCLLNVGRDVLGRVFFGASCLGASCLWGELSCFPQNMFHPVHTNTGKHHIPESTFNYQKALRKIYARWCLYSQG